MLQKDHQMFSSCILTDLVFFVFFLSVILSVMWKFPPELQRFSDVITTAVFFGQGCEMSV